jgi:hypothetical protein
MVNPYEFYFNLGNEIEKKMVRSCILHCDAEIVVRSVLPKLRNLKAPYKVVKDLALYRNPNNTSQRGKFIIIYTGDWKQAQTVLNSIESEL